MSDIEHEQFNEVVYLALSAFNAQRFNNKLSVESNLNNFVNHGCFKDRHMAFKIYYEISDDALKCLTDDNNYTPALNQFKVSIIARLNEYFNSNFNYTGIDSLPDLTLEIKASPAKRVHDIGSRKILPASEKKNSKARFLSGNVFLIAGLVGLGVLVGNFATLGGNMIAKGLFVTEGVSILVGLFVVCLIGAILLVYYSD